VGQETAHFHADRIAPGEKLEVLLTISVTLQDMEWRITDRDIGSMEEIPPGLIRHFLRDGKNYKLGEEVLLRAARSLETENAGVLEKVRLIQDFVMDHLEYARDNRWDPADKVLREGKGSCSEYTYLMIALCRLSGLPARYAGGTWAEDSAFASSGPEVASGSTLEGLEAAAGAGDVHVDRVFHRWVEVYLPRVGWFPVDPTRDDQSEKDGKPYRYFGRIPWSYLTMARGDGDRFESGHLGWEYRSSTRWAGSGAEPPHDVLVDRYAIWTRPQGRSDEVGAEGVEAGN
jgi:transglutaminase-like putative cysteine protease